MKKVNGKYIRLTETELKRLISEEVEKLLEYKNPRKNLVNAARNFVGGLVEHWAIIKFFKKTNLPTTDIGHWTKEVAKFMSNIAKVHLKGDMDNFETRKKAIMEGFERNDALSAEYCEEQLVFKLASEGVDASKHKETIKMVAEFYVDDVQRMIDILASGDAYEIGRYAYEEI